MTAGARERSGTGLTGTFGTPAVRTGPPRDFGPFDADDLDRPDPVAAVAGMADFGSIRVPVPAEGTVTVEPTASGGVQAVHVALPGGRLSVSALAAPRSAALWPDLVAEIDSSLREGGARVRSFRGEWGRELHARTGAAHSVFIGVDGARWMLYGVATGPAAHAEDLDRALRVMLKGTVVDRGRSPYPVRTVLPLVVPEHLADDLAEAVAGGAGTVPGPAPGASTPPAVGPSPAVDPEPAGSVVEPTTALPVQPSPVRSRPVPLRAPTPPRPVPADATQALPIIPRPVPSVVRPDPAVPVGDDAPPTGRWPAVAAGPDPAVPRPRAPATGGRRRAPEPQPVRGRRRAGDTGPLYARHLQQPVDVGRSAAGHVDLDALVRDRPDRRRARYDPGPEPTGRRRSPDGSDPLGGQEARGHPAETPTAPVPRVPAEPDRANPVDGPRDDGSAPAFLSGRPPRPAGRHRRRGPPAATAPDPDRSTPPGCCPPVDGGPAEDRWVGSERVEADDPQGRTGE